MNEKFCSVDGAERFFSLYKKCHVCVLSVLVICTRQWRRAASLSADGTAARSWLIFIRQHPIEEALKRVQEYQTNDNHAHKRTAVDVGVLGLRTTIAR